MDRKLVKIKKIICLFIITFVLSTICVMKKVEAASFSITSGISSTTAGNSYEITVNAEGITGRFDITHSSNVSVNLDSVFVDNGNAEGRIRVTANSPGNATVTLTPADISDSTTGDPITTLSARTDTVTVTAASSSGGSSSDNTSSSNNNSSSERTSSNTTSNAPTFSSVNETVYATSSVNVRSSYSTSSRVLGSLEEGDSVTRTGRATSAVNGITWSRVTYNGQTAYVSSQYLTTERPEESSNNNLRELTIEGDYELTPEFSSDVTEYDLTVGEDVESIEINAVPDDDTAEVEITGNENLLMGMNTVEIKVTSEDGTEKTYTINVTRGEAAGFGLSEITIEGYELTPTFSTDTHEYTVDIADLSVTSLNINAVPSEENATVEITGNDELQQGENIITILVKTEDGENTVTYQITANIHEAVAQTVEENNDDSLLLYGGIAIGVIIIIVIIIVIVRHNRNKYDGYEPYFGGVSSSDDDEEDEDQNITRTTKNNINSDSDIKSELNFDNISKSDTNTELNFENTNNEVSTRQNFRATKDEIKSELNFDKLNDNDIKPDLNFKSEENESMDYGRKNRKSIIDQNFGADVDTNRFDDDPPRRKRGKHF